MCLLACAAPTEPPRQVGSVPDGSLMTDATDYLAEPLAGSTQFLRYGFTVVTRFTNRSPAPVYLGRCYPASPQPMYWISAGDGSAVESAYDPIWACVGHDNQIEILPGAVRIDTFHVEGPNDFDGIHQQGIGATEGVFRLHLPVASARGDGAPAAAGSLGVSNAFTVHTRK
jgi:hypothetical protein